MDMSHMTALGVLGAFVGSMAGSLSLPRGILFGLLAITSCGLVPRKRFAIPLALALGVAWATFLYLIHHRFRDYSSDLMVLLFVADVTGVTLLGLIGIGIGALVRKLSTARR
jgi:hypothetical protein